MYLTFLEWLETFQIGNWYKELLQSEELAHAGFYRPNRQHDDDDDDTVKCIYCETEQSEWQLGKDPLVRHLCHSPKCPFVWSAAIDLCQIFMFNEQKLAHIRLPAWPQYCSRIARKESFKNWSKYLPVRPEKLVEAGFFYTGTGDSTICFYCGGGLHDWEVGEDPWQQHTFWYPHCKYLRLKDKIIHERKSYDEHD
ncbi:baculoviral IAP repeat-containing protein 3-like [Schistocerca nitens]|uniref:baculoviral IAP repeat-containing protein 3-like n=1 Tax=Schistocerca nitens TaxID=7011 RepID=UPI0021198D56|nr:baculoviral IAP repeat-containing protein 3-like [Schistocerca nitens]